MIYKAINPATEALIREYVSLEYDEAEQKILETHLAHVNWRSISLNQRKNFFQQLTNCMLKNKEKYAREITLEMGKPISQARAEIEKCIWLCQHYINHAESYLQTKLIKTEMAKTLVCYQPLGVIFCVMPWNFPFWQVLRCAVPAIMAGNAIILKHSPLTFGIGNTLEKMFLEADFPEHIFQHLIIDNNVATQVLLHPRVVALSFTGSEKIGRVVAGLAAANLKKAVLELGGNDPYIVLADADLDLAADSIVFSRLNNCGQVCIAAKRVIALREIKEELQAKILKLMDEFVMADPLLPSTKLGPMASYLHRENVHNQVLQSVQLGANLVTGGVIPNQRGFYYPPTLLDCVNPGMPAFDEELFGPVISIITANDEDEAIQLANQSQYGLGASVFTRDLKKGELIAKEKIEAGSCFVNAIVASDPRVPFGGIKCSGYGRELAQEGILEFVNIKTVSIK